MFTKINNVILPEIAEVGQGFTVIIETDGEALFAQINRHLS
jgi:hypothetical protein